MQKVVMLTKDWNVDVFVQITLMSGETGIIFFGSGGLVACVVLDVGFCGQPLNVGMNYSVGLELEMIDI